MRRWFFSVAIALPAFFVQATHGQDRPERIDGAVLRDLEYAKVGEVSLRLDLYLPPRGDGEPKPGLIVWIHGGGWRNGSKNGNPMAWLTGHGYAVASIAYRLTDVAIFPAQIHDCKGAIRWLRANAEKHGYDATRIGVSGASAGGHLAALLGTSGGVKELEGDVGGNIEQSSRVQAVVDYCGPTNFLLFLGGPGASNPDGAMTRLFGGLLRERQELAKQGSPATHVGEGDAPILCIHGEDDRLVPVGQAQHIHERYQAAGLDSTLHVIPGVAHVGREFWDRQRREMIVAFYQKHLIGAAK